MNRGGSRPARARTGPVTIPCPWKSTPSPSGARTGSGYRAQPEESAGCREQPPPNVACPAGPRTSAAAGPGARTGRSEGLQGGLLLLDDLEELVQLGDLEDLEDLRGDAA